MGKKPNFKLAIQAFSAGWMPLPSAMKWSGRYLWSSTTRLLLNIRCYSVISSIANIERLLSAVWITNKQTKFLPGDQFKVYHPSFALRQDAQLDPEPFLLHVSGGGGATLAHIGH